MEDFRNKLKAYHKTLSPQMRYFYCHETSVIVSTLLCAHILPSHIADVDAPIAGLSRNIGDTGRR